MAELPIAQQLTSKHWLVDLFNSLSEIIVETGKLAFNSLSEIIVQTGKLDSHRY